MNANIKNNTVMKKIFLILMFAAVVLPLSAQKYGFYGRGKVTGRSYHNGANGTYIGYHPAGISHSRNSFSLQMFGTDDSRRSGRSIAPQVDREATGTNSWDIQTPQVTRRPVEINIPNAGNHERSTNNESVTRTNLGLSTEVMEVSHHSWGGGSSSGFSYGRTGGGESVIDKVVSFAGFSSAPESLASTTNDNLDSDAGSDEQGFMAPSDWNAPIGDAVVPLVLLLLPIVIVKLKLRK